MNEGAFRNCNAEDYNSIQKVMKTEADTIDINAYFRILEKVEKKERRRRRKMTL
jgi:hypothetical protein